MLVVFGADPLAVSIVEQPLVHLAIARTVEFATDELAGLVDQARAWFPRWIEVFPDLCDPSLAVVMDDAVDFPIAVCVLLHQVQDAIPITVPLIHSIGTVYLDEGQFATRVIVVPLVRASIVVGIKGDLPQLAVLKSVPLFELPIPISVHLGAQ